MGLSVPDFDLRASEVLNNCLLKGLINNEINVYFQYFGIKLIYNYWIIFF